MRSTTGISRRRWLAVACALVAGVAAGMAAGATRADDPPPIVRLEIDYGDGVEKHFTGRAWREGMTVLDAMRQAADSPHGIAFDHRGSGATAFLTRIDDVENEGGAGRNWIYRVNGRLADRSFGVYELEAGDTVQWRFSEYEDE
jgi:hypothetical protein